MANGDVIKLGTLYMGGTRIPRPTNPWRNDSEPYTGAGVGNIQNYSVGATLEIRNTETNYEMQWIEVNDGGKKYLICDRVMLVNISWDDLNAQQLVTGKTVTIDGQQYKLRLLTGGSNYRSGTDAYSGGSPSSNEWDRWVVNEAGLSGLPTPASSDLDSTLNSTDKNSMHNQKWNWMGVYSWAQETYTGGSASRAVRGCGSARFWHYGSSGNRYTIIGWRPVLEVLNSAPVVSGSDSNLGNKSAPFTINYSVGDTDTGDTLTVTEKVDATTIRTINNAVRGQTYTLDLSSVWSSLSLGSHTITITVTDGKGGTATRTYTFTKTDDRIKFTLKNTIETSIAAKKLVVSGVMTVPNGATLSIKACNNGFDASPTWEDITTAFLNRQAYSFANTTKTAAKWGINIQFEILKGTATDQIIVDGFGFSFE
ncbi:Ig-like domain-containing protein [Anoxybacillus gonensis]|uniref:Ig-like domain-containing protein n=1 Tax=Anoxybacillus gonensis TaxID=198467 RepID=UPI0002BF16BA|nr:hypothetical protein [Anoxybacillus gonensis]EMI10356.1 hypothetical protein F510_1663 [Anoxybacillus gonensis]